MYLTFFPSSFHWQTICLRLEVSRWFVTSRTFGHNVSMSESHVILNCGRRAAWCFYCAVNSQNSTVWSVFLDFVFLMIASITLCIRSFWRVTRVWILKWFLCWLGFSWIIVNTLPSHLQIVATQWISFRDMTLEKHKQNNILMELIIRSQEILISSFHKIWVHLHTILVHAKYKFLATKA